MLKTILKIKKINLIRGIMTTLFLTKLSLYLFSGI